MSVELKPDRRQEKTHQAIVGAFFALLFERPYGAITVATVAERANVGRSTFYEHFRTKADLLAHSLAGPLSILATAVTAPNPTSDLTAILQHFRDNHSLGRVLFAPPTRQLLVRVLAAEIDKCLDDAARAAPLAGMRIAAAQLALVEPWSLGQIAASAESVALSLSRSSHGMAVAMNDKTNHPFVR